MSKSNAVPKEAAAIGHNSASPEFIVNSAKAMAAIDAQRKELNGDAADIRQALKDKGVDRDAFRDAYNYFKKRRHEREGFDESHKICWDALNAADTADMFSFQNDKD